MRQSRWLYRQCQRARSRILIRFPLENWIHALALHHLGLNYLQPWGIKFGTKNPTCASCYSQQLAHQMIFFSGKGCGSPSIACVMMVAKYIFYQGGFCKWGQERAKLGSSLYKRSLHAQDRCPFAHTGKKCSVRVYRPTSRYAWPRTRLWSYLSPYCFVLSRKIYSV